MPTFRGDWRPTMALTASMLLAGMLHASGGEAAAPKRLVEASGIQGGLVVHVGGGDAERTAALRVNDRYLVQGLERDTAQVAKARSALRGLGVLGPVTTIAWDGKRLPYADGVVNLVVASVEGQVSSEEIARVLAPGGVVLAGADSLDTRLREGDEAPLRRAEAARHLTLDTSASSGLKGWTKAVKPWPKDIDEWTHFLHGPDNNAVANDTRIEPPRHMQWVAGPRWARSHDHLASVSAAVTAAGRLFCIIDEGPTASVKAPAKWMLVARDAFNGVLLWKKPVGPWEGHLRPFRSGPAELPRRLVAVGNRVYVTLGYGKPVTALDAATGDVVRTYEGTDNTHEIVVHRGTLYLVISAPLTRKSPTTGRVLRKFALWRGAYDEYVIEYMPKHVRAIDAATGRLVWKKEGRDVVRILPLTLIASGGRVFFQNESHVVALKAGSGDELWRAERPGPRQRYAWLTPTLVAADGVVLSGDRAADKPVDTGAEDKARFEWRVSANHILTGGEIVAFDEATGTKLWTAPCHEGFNSPVDIFVVDGKVWSGELAWGRQPGITKVYDLKTGKVVAERTPDQKTYTLGFGHTRCYRHKATSKYVLHGRAGVEFVDLNADRVIAHHWVRGACQYGILPANGLLYAPSHPCACYITAKLNGFVALAGARGDEGRGARDEQKTPRLQRGPAHESSLDTRHSTLDTSTDWPTYRRDPARSGASSVGLSPRLGPKWEMTLGGALTAIAVAEGRLFVAQREAHTLHALDAETGSPAWSFAAGGRVDSPPTIHGGRAYFGSADGWMYCLRARDGALAWRFRAAPASQQIVSYDQLESVWPVHGTVLVCDGPKGRPVAYAVAGRSSYIDGGIFLCGVDAATGELVVERRISHRDPKTGLEPQNTIRGVSMPGALPDVLSAQGTSLFLRHLHFDLEGNTLPEKTDHLFSAAGYLDDTWWHRAYWQLGTSMGGGYGGWTSAGNSHVSGRLLVKSGDRVFGYGRKGYTITGSHLGMQSEYHLFAADTKLIKQAPPPKAKRRRGPGTKVKYHWSRSIPFLVRAMVLAGGSPPRGGEPPAAAGGTLFIAGPADVGDLDAAKPTGAVSLWAVSAVDGSTLAKYTLKAPPVFDSFGVTKGRLYFTTVDGRVVCRESQ